MRSPLRRRAVRLTHAAVALLAGLAVTGPPLSLAGGAEGSSPRTVPAISGSGQWAWPVSGARVVVRPYLAPVTPWAAGHRGIDIEAVGSGARTVTVRAPADGVVHFVGVVVNRPVLSIEHAGGLLSSFEPVQSDLAAGQRVHRGDPVGTLVTGHCEIALCLHFGVRLSGEYVSPLLMLGGVPRAVLVPTRDG